jgi:hypothetical protein
MIYTLIVKNVNIFFCCTLAEYNLFTHLSSVIILIIYFMGRNNYLQKWYLLIIFYFSANKAGNESNSFVFNNEGCIH